MHVVHERLQLRAALKPTSCFHDVCFVFRNDQAKPQPLLVVAMTATFVAVP